MSCVIGARLKTVIMSCVIGARLKTVIMSRVIGARSYLNQCKATEAKLTLRKHVHAI